MSFAGWHACWWQKYLTLLYYFNALPATISVCQLPVQLRFF